MDDQGLQPLQHNDQNALVGTTTSSKVPPAPQSQSQNQNQAALAASNSHSPFSDITSFLNLDDYVGNPILSNDAFTQMMWSDQLLESEQFALAMIASPEKTQLEEYNNNDDDNNNNVNENQLNNEPSSRQVWEAVGNPPSDGDNWRKYGQKHLKGNNFPRSYYKCTYFNCKATKKIEYSAQGYVTEIIYKGSHDHPKVNPSCDLVSEYLAQEMAYDVDEGGSRRQLDRYVATAEMSSSSRSARQPKYVTRMESHHEVFDDEYRWRKYGQKVVKGNSNPRSYYKCTHTGCIVRKHTERAVDDPKILVTTYEGNHNHGIQATNYNIDNNFSFTTTNSSLDHRNQTNSLQRETTVEVPTMANEEKFMGFECPNPLKVVPPGTINSEQYPRSNFAFRPIVTPYAGNHGPLESRAVMAPMPYVEHNASSSMTRLSIRATIPEGYDPTTTMAPPKSRQM